MALRDLVCPRDRSPLRASSSAKFPWGYRSVWLCEEAKHEVIRYTQPDGRTRMTETEAAIASEESP